MHERNLKLDRQQWADNTAKDGEATLIARHLKDGFEDLKRLAKVTRPVSSQILDANGNLISDKSQKLEC